jgi:hypothetical protein
MKTNNRITQILDALEEHRGLLAAEWKREFQRECLGKAKTWSLDLDSLLEQFVDYLKDREGSEVEDWGADVPFEAAQHDVECLYAAEHSFVRAYRKQVPMDTAQWLPIRKYINEIFHEILRKRATQRCEVCECCLHEALANTRRAKETSTIATYEH